MAALRRLPAVLLLVVSAFVFTSATRAHPLKLSVTEATYNRDSGRLELAIRFFTDDLEAALSAVAGQPVSVAKPEEFSPLALDYLRTHFLVKSAKGEPQRLEWAGMDTTDTQVWIFCEFPLPGGLVGARLNVTLLHEAFADQINTVKLRDGAFKQTLIFGTGTGELVVKTK